MDNQKEILQMLTEIKIQLTELENVQAKQTKQLNEVQMYVRYLYLGRSADD